MPNRKSETYISPYQAQNRNMLNDRKMTVQPFDHDSTAQTLSNESVQKIETAILFESGSPSEAQDSKVKIT